jgi:uncharacterized protein (TIGR02453 family)
MQIPFQGFPSETLKFLKQLKRNNNRDWFLAHKAVYEERVKRPMVDLVTTLGGAMQGFAPELVSDPKRAIFRIYRDTRFSPDKTPYKTHIAAHFRPSGAGKDAGAGLYFHLDPDQVLVAGGVYMPPSPQLRVIRDYVAAHAEELRRILREPRFKKLYFGLQGEVLVRPPKGYTAEHPALDLLRHKHYVAWCERPSATAETSSLFPFVVDAFVVLMPLVRYLNRALSVRSSAP